MQKQKRLIALITIVSMIIVSGCSSSSGGSTVINGGDQIEHSKQKQAYELQETINKEKEDVDRHFGSGFYFEDFSEEEAELNDYFAKRLEAELQSVNNVEFDFEMKIENEYYNDSLNEYREGALDKSVFYDEPETYIREIDCAITMFGGEYTFDESVAISYKLENIETRWNNFGDWNGDGDVTNDGVRKWEVTCIDYDLTRKQMEGYEFNGPIGADDPYVSHITNYAFDTHEGSSTAREWDFEVLDRLKEKYNEDFVFIEPNISSPTHQSVYAPVSDESLEFVTEVYSDEPRDTYKSVLAQKVLSEKVDKIIKDAGAEDYIVQLSIPNSPDPTSDPYAKPYDTSNISENENFLDEVYLDNSFHISLYFLESKENIDFLKIKNIVSQIDSLVSVMSHSHVGWLKRISIFVFFVEIDENHREIVVKEFKENTITEKEFRGYSSLENIQYDLWKTDADTDAFKLIDIIGKSHTGVLKILQYDESLTIEEFVEEYKVETKYD
ncbi:hypothetical protein [Fusibacter sp. JL216-2]|uniref:hypothetical protein n=1 Tax=Fusibacter sp. JL216-2 TaxID=3071453 RepID=UPI003D3373EE